MKPRHFHSLWGMAMAMLLLLAFTLRAEDAPAPSVAPVPEAPTAAPAALAEPAKAEAAKSEKTAETASATAAEKAKTADDAALRRLDRDNSAASETERRAQRNADRAAARARRAAHRSGSQDVQFLQNVTVAKDQTVDQAVAIKGNLTINGHAGDQAVAVMGNATVNGSVGDQVVSVLGTTTINGSVGDQAVAVGGDVVVNGRVGGQVVAVGGSVKLGPEAVVNGEVVVVGGALERSPGAVVRGSVQQVRLPAINWLFGWVRSALFKGRLLSFAGDASWAWGVALGFLALYVFLALVFRRGIEKCAETLEQKPGYTILAALLTMLALPLLFLLLAITGIGVVAVPFLAVGLMVCRLFGRAAMLAWIGRRVTGRVQGGAFSHPAVAILIGGAIVGILYLVPVVALVLHMLIGVLGLGMVIYALIVSMRRNGKKPAPAVAGAAPTMAMAAIPIDSVVAGGAAPAQASAMPPSEGVPPVVPETPPVSAPPPVMPVAVAATLPRAGFWLRLAASALDAVLIGLASAILHVPGGFPLLFVSYCVVLWALRGTTVGGVICGLKIVRLDGRKVDWSVAVVRVLAAFLSLAVIGLGFIWVAFDDGQQSWHDKIAGTTIVRMPQGVSLI